MYDCEQCVAVITISWCGLSYTCYPSPHTRRSMWHVSDRFQPSSTSDERNYVKLHPILPHQKAPKLRFVSSVELRNSSGKSPVPALTDTYTRYTYWHWSSGDPVSNFSICSIQETQGKCKIVEISYFFPFLTCVAFFILLGFIVHFVHLHIAQRSFFYWRNIKSVTF